MIFLPNFFDKYTATLRNTVQNFISKNGFSKKYVEMLRKIYIAEAMFYYSETEPINIKHYILDIIEKTKTYANLSLTSVNLIFGNTNNFLINKKLFTILILEVLKNSDNVLIETANEEITIQSDCNLKHIYPQIIYLCGRCYYEIKSNRTLLVFNVTATEKSPLKTNKDWEIVSNPYSLINLFLQ